MPEDESSRRAIECFVGRCGYALTRTLTRPETHPNVYTHGKRGYPGFGMDIGMYFLAKFNEYPNTSNLQYSTKSKTREFHGGEILQWKLQ